MARGVALRDHREADADDTLLALGSDETIASPMLAQQATNLSSLRNALIGDRPEWRAT